MDDALIVIFKVLAILGILTSIVFMVLSRGS